MNPIANQILFWNLQRSKSKNNKKVIRTLRENLIKLKTVEDNAEFDDIYNTIFNNSSTQSYISCNLFPKKIEDIGRYTEIGFSGDVVKEIRWHLKTIEKYKTTINDFLRIRETIDELIFYENYQKAESEILACEEKYGVSLWLLEEKACVYNNLKEDTSIITQGCKQNMITSIIDFYIMRSSKEVTFTDYNYFVQREISKFLRMRPDAKNVVSMYHYMIAPYSFEINDENIIYILRFIFNMPLFDRYLCIIDLCEFIITKSENIQFVDKIKEYLRYLYEIDDETITVMNIMLYGIDQIVCDKVLEDPLLDAKNKFITGMLEECLEEIVQYINTNKFNIHAYNMLVETMQLLNKNIANINLNPISKNLVSQLISIYSIDDDFSDSFELVRKKVISCVHSLWARDINNSIIKVNQPIDEELQKYAVKYSNFQNLTIETICENLEQKDALVFFDSVQTRNNYLNFWYAYLLDNQKEIEKNCKLPDIVNLLSVYKKGEFKFFDGFLYSKKMGSIMKNRFIKRMWSNISTGHDMEAAIDYFIKMFVKQEYYVMLAPIDKFIDYVKASKNVNKKDLRVPILFYINSTYFDESKRDDLTIACENYFDLNEIEKPSQLIINKNEIEKAIYFLKNICIPQIMGPVILTIRTVKGLDQERIETCQLLRQIDPSNEKIYEDEIMEITRKLFINEGLMTIESNKIHVNTDGLKLKLIKNLKSEFNNFLYYRNHQIDSVLQIIKNIEDGDKYKIITFNESQMFNEIVYKIRNEFVLGGEYSLDGYLSINIRHGILDGQIRAPLSKYNLLTTYKIENDGYDISERWTYAIKDYNLKVKVKEAIIQFNKEIEQIIFTWRNELIQISTEEKPSQGIFDYSLKEADIRMLQTYLTENITLEDFIDILFEYLWGITEKNLSKMKTIINEDISVQVNNAFEKLINVYREVNEKNPFPDALRWLGSVKNEMDEELDKISNWFCRSAESQQADFDLEYAMQIGFKMIQSIHPERKFVLNIVEKNSKQKIKGKYLKCYWEIFYTQFDNISKYASVVEDVISIDCELRVERTGIYIKMQNDYDCSNGIIGEMERIESAKKIISDKAYLAKAKQEGGSGIPKIYKIMSSDLNMTTNINCQFDKESNKFYIEIEGAYK